MPTLAGDDHQIPIDHQKKGFVDSNYNNPSLDVGEEDSEVVQQLKLQNKALFELLKNQLKKTTSSQSNDEEDDTAASSTKPPPSRTNKSNSKGKGIPNKLNLNPVC